MGKEKRPFCCHQNFVPNGLSAPAWDYIHMVKHEKNVYKIRLQSNFFKPATNGQSDKGFLFTSKVCPQGIVCHWPGAIYIYKIVKNVYKIGFFFTSPEPLGSQGELIVYPYSGVRCRCCRQQCLNIFSSETALPIKAKFYVESPWEGGTKVCINGPGHMTKMAAMPIYGKNL